jgi:hypothetical protein
LRVLAAIGNQWKQVHHFQHGKRQTYDLSGALHGGAIHRLMAGRGGHWSADQPEGACYEYRHWCGIRMPDVMTRNTWHLLRAAVTGKDAQLPQLYNRYFIHRLCHSERDVYDKRSGISTGRDGSALGLTSGSRFPQHSKTGDSDLLIFCIRP